LQSGPYIPTWSSGAVLEWDYGWMKRQVHLCPRGLRELFIIHDAPQIPLGAARLIIDTTPSLDDGIVWLPPYALSRSLYSDRISEVAVVVSGHKELPVAFLKKPFLPIEIDDSPETYYTTAAEDGTLSKEDASFASVHDAAAANGADSTGIQLSALCYWADALYKIRRVALVVDTSPLPDTAVISDTTKARIYVCYVGLNGTSVVIDGGSATCPHDTLVVGDYDRTHYGQADGGSRASCTNNSWNDITLTATGRGWINKTGKTRLCVIEKDHDYNNSSPGADTYGVGARSANYDGGSLKPELVVYYTGGEAQTHKIFSIA